MSDSEKTNDLDNYGVWVKKPPRTVSSENTTDSQEFEFPDFSASDIIDNTPFDSGDTALSATELSALTDDPGTQISQIEEPPVDSIEDTPFEADFLSQDNAEPQAGSLSGTEEISLDEFIEGGVFDGDEQNSTEPITPSSSASQENVPEEIPEESSEQSFTDDLTISDSVESPSLSDDSPINIDLSFDDSMASPQEESGFASSPASSDGGGESIDLSDFGVDFGSDSSSATESSDGSESVDLSEFGVDFSSDDNGSSSNSPQEEASSDGTQSVDMSEFGVDFSSDNGEQSGAQEETPAVQETAAEESSADENGMESISLDSFGFDINAEESVPAGTTEPKEETPEPQEESSSFETESSDDSLTITDDDDLSLSAEPQQELAASSPVTPSPSSDAEDDGFDVDSIMSSIEDENGSVVSLSDESGIQSSQIDEPQIVENDEPVFEETSVDEAVSETSENIPADDFAISFDSSAGEGDTGADAEEKTVSEDIFTPPISSQEENPFTLPEENAFISGEETNQSAESPASQEEAEPSSFEDFTEKTISFDDSSATEDAFSFDDAITNEAAADESSSFTENTANIEETQVENSFETPLSQEAPAFETETEPQAEDFAFTQETQDESPKAEENEIEKSTNNILSQIVSELASLKSEISGLKNDFEELKNKTPDEFKIEEAKTSEKTEQTGFFSDEDEDETIALSVDELDNILNTVEIVEGGEEQNQTGEENALSSSFDEGTSPLEESFTEPQENNFSGESDIQGEETPSIETEETDFDFSTDNLEEPSLDTIEDNQELPDEILVPKVDDILVESGSANIIDEPAETQNTSDAEIETENIQDAEEDGFDSIPQGVSASQESDDNLDSFSFENSSSSEAADETPSVDEPFIYDDAQKNISITEEEVQDLLDKENSIDDTLTDDNLNYLASDEEGMKASALQGNANSTIPGELQKEIKSVLSYMDQLLENLPEDKIAEFAQSEQFETYKKLFKELGLA